MGLSGKRTGSGVRGGVQRGTAGGTTIIAADRWAACPPKRRKHRPRPNKISELVGLRGVNSKMGREEESERELYLPLSLSQGKLRGLVHGHTLVQHTSKDDDRASACVRDARRRAAAGPRIRSLRLLGSATARARGLIRSGSDQIRSDQTGSRVKLRDRVLLAQRREDGGHERHARPVGGDDAVSGWVGGACGRDGGTHLRVGRDCECAAKSNEQAPHHPYPHPAAGRTARARARLSPRRHPALGRLPRLHDAKHRDRHAREDRRDVRAVDALEAGGDGGLRLEVVGVRERAAAERLALALVRLNVCVYTAYTWVAVGVGDGVCVALRCVAERRGQVYLRSVGLEPLAAPRCLPLSISRPPSTAH